MLGGSGISLETVNPSAAVLPMSSECRPKDAFSEREVERLEIPLAARPRGRFLRFGGCWEVAELGRDLSTISAREAVSCWLFDGGGGGACVSGFVVTFGRLWGEFGGNPGFAGDAVRGRDAGFVDLSFSASVSSAFGGRLAFRGDRLGESSCSGCEPIVVGAASALSGAEALSGTPVSSSSSSCTIGWGLDDLVEGLGFAVCSDSDGIAWLLRVLERRFEGMSPFLEEVSSTLLLTA